jgi:hypothetical protein
VLNAGVLLFDGTGRIRNTTTGPPNAFNAAIDTRNGLLLLSVGTPSVFVNGAPFDNVGALCVSGGGIVGYAQGGLPITIDNQIAADNATAIGSYVAGLPFTTGGKLALAVAE